MGVPVVGSPRSWPSSETYALLAPWGSVLVRMRVQALINGAQAIRAAREPAGDVLPVPLHRWLALTGADRAAHVAEWRDSLGAAAPV